MSMANETHSSTLAPGKQYQTPKGLETRKNILALAMDIASAEGLEGLTIGRLARETGLSKSGLFAHFGSKTDLQRATVDAASEVFQAQVMDPVAGTPHGLARLDAMMHAWLGYVEQSGFRGGCFFAAASSEFDGRPGPVRDRIAARTRHWLGLLEEEARTALENGELQPGTDPAVVAFALHAYAHEANWAYQLLDDPKAFVRARRAVAQRLKGMATRAGLSILAETKTVNRATRG